MPVGKIYSPIFLNADTVSPPENCPTLKLFQKESRWTAVRRCPPPALLLSDCRWRTANRNKVLVSIPNNYREPVMFYTKSPIRFQLRSEYDPKCERIILISCATLVLHNRPTHLHHQAPCIEHHIPVGVDHHPGTAVVVALGCLLLFLLLRVPTRVTALVACARRKQDTRGVQG